MNYTFAQLDEVQCWGMVRVYFLDNMNYLWGTTLAGDGITNASVIPATFAQEGIGTRNKATGNKVTWNNLIQPIPLGNLPFLATKDETFGSGS
jgi:hypothetical protein